jgi:hypothetical protein
MDENPYKAPGAIEVQKRPLTWRLFWGRMFFVGLAIAIPTWLAAHAVDAWMGSPMSPPTAVLTVVNVLGLMLAGIGGLGWSIIARR